ncbi:MAG TPA: TonB family protein [Acetobacteraceae bacterium]|nr:TonB family protein [Acetobacteraceae bacterium]
MLHATTAAIIGLSILLAPRRPDEPDRRAEIDLVIGTNAAMSGGATMTVPVPPSPAARPPPPPPVRPRAERAAEPPPVSAAPPSPGDIAVPPPDPARASAPAQAETATQPQPERIAARDATPPGAPPTIRVGDGIAAAYAEIEGIGQVHRATSMTGNLPPEYPIEAARRGEQGTVVLRIFIAADGRVTHVDVIQSSGSAILDRAARDRIATWRFNPAVLDGKPVESTEEQPIRFLP